jgi:transposase
MHPTSGQRRRHSDELKAKVVAACNEPGGSISGVALAHGLNANLVRKWRTGRGTKRAGMAITPAAASKAAPRRGTTAEFVAIEMPAPAQAAARAAAEATAAAPIGELLIHIERKRLANT